MLKIYTLNIDKVRNLGDCRSKDFSLPKNIKEITGIYACIKDLDANISPNTYGILNVAINEENIAYSPILLLNNFMNIQKNIMILPTPYKVQSNSMINFTIEEFIKNFTGIEQYFKAKIQIYLKYR
ncbi:MAG: hypothetical protein LBS50_10995 [Prevotellaceae bacterium]|jgi:hypothetical protein|nr:hypothetical protein [Prevotellaceae bacterium]